MSIERTQEQVMKWLEGHEIYPMSVTWTYEFGGLLAITFWVASDLHECLEILGYQRKCDKSGYDIFEQTNTLNISGMGLVDLIRVK